MTRVKSDWTASSGITGSVATFLIPFLRSDCPARLVLPCHLNDSFANLTSVTDNVNHGALDRPWDARAGRRPATGGRGASARELRPAGPADRAGSARGARRSTIGPQRSSSSATGRNEPG